MAAKRNGSSQLEAVSDTAKIARLLAMSAIKEMTTIVDKAVFLRSSGFTNPEIAAMLNLTNNNVAVAFVQSRKKKRKKRA